MKFNVKNTNFDPKQTLFCGQCFRWSEQDGVFSGIVAGKRVAVAAVGDEIVIESEHTREFLENYFDLNTDYSAYIEKLS
ncbi:MAG: 8-oxoguanine DNA glycosylase, N-terminal domain-containing protein, partial [Oscillospiraceae bacterium]|nr:8-oxoguanine DNA glycosylase, N-terminal domain-containing protein [Oscillospiraceae bacterium]